VGDVLDDWIEQNLTTWAPSSSARDQSRVASIKMLGRPCPARRWRSGRAAYQLPFVGDTTRCGDRPMGSHLVGSADAATSGHDGTGAERTAVTNDVRDDNGGGKEEQAGDEEQQPAVPFAAGNSSRPEGERHQDDEPGIPNPNQATPDIANMSTPVVRASSLIIDAWGPFGDIAPIG
jgi:hypothetical protein